MDGLGGSDVQLTRPGRADPYQQRRQSLGRLRGQHVWSLEGSTWTQHGSGHVADVAASGNVVLEIERHTSVAGRIYRGHTWTGWEEVTFNLPEKARSIRINNADQAWVVLEDDTFWYFGSSSWHQYGGGHVYDVAANADGQPWLIEQSPNQGNVYRGLSGGGWENMQFNLPGQARRITIAPDGVPWVVLEDGTFYYLAM